MQGDERGRMPPTVAMQATPAPPSFPAPSHPAPAPAQPSSGGGAGGVIVAVAAIGCLGVFGLLALSVGSFFAWRAFRDDAREERAVVAPAVGGVGAPTVGITDPYASERMAVVIPETAPSRGPVDAPVTIVEAGDFQCPFCARASDTVARLLADHPSDVRVVWIDHPLPFHASARMAARAAREARDEGGDARFWVMHDLLLAEATTLDRASIARIGARAGLDPARLAVAIDSSAHDPRIDADVALAERFGARGTPGFFVNGRRLMGAQPYARFAQMIDEELAHARRLEASGVARADIYRTLTARASTVAIADAPSPAARPREEEDPSRVHRVPVGAAATLGPADALVTIVVFSDFQCPFCSRLAPTLARIREQYGQDVRVVFRHHPLSFHQRALPAAIASSEVYAIGGAPAFFRMHDILFENQRALEDDDLVRYAEQAGVPGARVRRALATSAHRAEIQADQDLAESVGASGTPTSFVNGRALRGAQPYEAFARLVDEELAHARAMVAAGTPRDRVYDVIMAGAR